MEKWHQLQQPRHIPELDGLVEAPGGKDGRVSRVDGDAGEVVGVAGLQGFDARHFC